MILGLDQFEFQYIVRSSVRYVIAWSRMRDRAVAAILLHICRLCKTLYYLQWIAYHVDIYGIEITYSFAKQGITVLPQENLALTFKEVFSKEKYRKNTESSSNLVFLDVP